MSVIVKYDSNNSGGNWWLTDKDWHNLAEAGWTVFWAEEKGSRPHNSYVGKDTTPEMLLDRSRFPYTESRWLGALAMGCAKKFNSIEEGITEWEKITGENAASIGCTCCGPPHDFEWYDEDGKSHTVGLSYGVGTLNY